MSVKDQLTNGLKSAMRDQDNNLKRVIRMVLSSIKNNEIDKGKELSDEDVIFIIHKEIKSRHEVIDSAKINNRQDLINEAENDIKILEKFLPEGLSEKQILSIVKAAILEVDAKSPADMGKVMKVVLPRIAGRAPGNQISQIVKELLNN